MGEAMDGIDSFLACPDCHGPLESLGSIDYACHNSGREIEYRRANGLPDLLPHDLGGRDCLPKEVEKFPHGDLKYREEVTGEEVTLDQKTVWRTLDYVHHQNLRGSDDLIRNLIEGLPHSDGRLDESGVRLVSGAYLSLFQQYRDQILPECLANFLGVVSLARYEAETARMLDYPGNFCLPDDMIGMLPENAVVAEIGVGNGKTLRRIEEIGDPRFLVGLDNCYGMVRAADALTTRNRERFFYGLGDAHYLPLADNSVDAVLMFNVLDRLQDPARVFGHVSRVLKPGGRIFFGNCMPLQYVIRDTESGLEINPVDPDYQFDTVDQAVEAVGEVEIVGTKRKIPWFPQTVLQGVEPLEVDVVAATLKR